MSRSGLLFALFCLGVVGAVFPDRAHGYSPFADGGARRPMFYRRPVDGGPHHK